MAKANNTAIESLVQFMDGLLGVEDNLIKEYGDNLDAVKAIKDNWQQLNMIKQMIVSHKKVERKQIENAWNSAKNHPNNYHDAQHYFFMQYIDND